MSKFYVIVHYEGACDYEIEAKDQEEAESIALDRFGEESPSHLIMNLADCEICDSYEIKK